MKNLIRRFRTNDKGATLIFVALMMVIIIGFGALVVDTGILFQTRRQLQTVADAAALAGAQEFAKNILAGETEDKAKDNAEVCANEYISKYVNNVKNIKTLTCEADITTYKVTVKVSKNDIGFFFAPVLNSSFTEGKRSATAVALTGPLVSIEGGSPLIFPRSNTPTPGILYDLKYGASDWLLPGAYGSLNFAKLLEDVDGKYTDFLRDGYPGVLKVGDSVEYLNGVKQKQNKAAIVGIAGDPGITMNGRIPRCLALHGDSCSHTNILPNCPRLVIIPICDIADNKYAIIKNFAAFYIQSYGLPPGEHGQGQQTIQGYYIINSIASGEVGGKGSPGIGGVWGVNLIK